MIVMICGVCGGKNGMKRASDGPFSLSPAEEERLVRRGVAAYVPEEPVSPVATLHVGDDDNEKGVNTDDENTAADGQETPDSESGEKVYLDREQLAAMDYNELKKLAADMGAKPASQKKEDLIAAIAAIPVEPGPAEEQHAPDDDEEPPEVTPEEPVGE